MMRKHVDPISSRYAFLTVALFFAAVGEVPAQEKLPAGARVVRVEVEPMKVELKHRYDCRQILLTGQLETGERIDVTRMATIASPADLVKISATGLVRPVADG